MKLSPLFKLLPEIGCVYKVVFSNGCFYIGSTKNLKTRMLAFKSQVHNKICNKNIITRCDGLPIIDIQILEPVNNISKLFEREDFYIKSSINNPDILNRSASAFSNKGIKWDSRDKSSKGIKKSEEVKMKMRKPRSEAAKARMRGRKLTATQIAAVKRIADKLSVKISQYDIYGNYIATYKNSKIASLHTRISSTTISNNVRGVIQNVFGHTFKKASETDVIQIISNPVIKKERRFYFNNEMVAIFELSKKFGISLDKIRTRMKKEGMDLETAVITPLRRNDIDIDEVMAMISKGISINKIADHFNSCHNAIKYKIKKHFPEFYHKA